MARKRRSSGNAGLWVLGIVVVVALVLFAMGVPQEAFDEGVKVDTKDCENAPYLDPSYYEKGTGDAISSVETYAIVDGRRAKNISTSDTFQLGSSYKIMAKKDNYLNDEEEDNNGEEEQPSEEEQPGEEQGGIPDFNFD